MSYNDNHLLGWVAVRHFDVTIFSALRGGCRLAMPSTCCGICKSYCDGCTTFLSECGSREHTDAGRVHHLLITESGSAQSAQRRTRVASSNAQDFKLMCG